jgi:HSP20 family molecular chaperone IbpA
VSRARRFARALGTAVAKRAGRVAGRLQAAKDAPVDLLESESAYLVVLDAPGADPGDVQVRFDDGELAVRIRRFRGHAEGFEMRYPGRTRDLETRTRLPAGATIDPSAATATLRTDGTLHVTLPKTGGETDDGPVSVDIEDGTVAEE